MNEISNSNDRKILKFRSQITIGLVVLLVLVGVGLFSRFRSLSTEQSVPTGQSVSTGQSATAEALDSLDAANTAISNNPQDPLAWYARGVYLQLEGSDLETAIESYGKALEISPEFLSALFNRGLAYRSLGRLEEAKADLEQIVLLRQGIAPRALFNLGLIAYDQGDTKLGDEYTQRAYEQDPSLGP